MTKRKILVIVLACILSLIMFISFAPKTYAYSEQNRISVEVQEHIDNEELPSWHVMYKNYPYYQVIYQKFCGSAESLAYFAGISETHLREMFNWYIGDTTEWMEMLSKLHLDVTKIEPNSTLGIYFDGQFLNLIWTSEYIPNETLNLKSIHYKANGGLNGLWNHEMNYTCEHLTGDEIFELTEHLFIMESEQHVVCQINKTPVMAYHVCDDDEVICYGIGVEGLKNFTITGWEAELDHFQTHEDSDGYFKPTNTGINGSFAIARIQIINTEDTRTIKLLWMQSTESVYDFGLIGKIDVALSQSTNVDSDVLLNAKKQTATTPMELWLEAPTGTHFYDVKYRKNSSFSGWYMFQFQINIIEKVFAISSDRVIITDDYVLKLSNIDCAQSKSANVTHHVYLDDVLTYEKKEGI